MSADEAYAKNVTYSTKSGKLLNYVGPLVDHASVPAIHNRAQANAATSISNATFTLLPLTVTTTSSSQLGSYDESNGVFTASVSGGYLFSGKLTSNTATDLSVKVVPSGGDNVLVHVGTPVNVSEEISFSNFQTLDAGDNVSFYAYHEEGSAVGVHLSEIESIQLWQS